MKASSSARDWALVRYITASAAARNVSDVRSSATVGLDVLELRYP